MDLFFDERVVRFQEGDRVRTRIIGSAKAKEICHSCPEQFSCLLYSLTSWGGKPEPFGIYGGLDRGERKDLIKTLTKRKGKK